MRNSENTGGYWLLRNSSVLSSVEVAGTYLARAIGLLGKKSYDGAMLFPRTRAVHTLGMSMAIDVAFLDRSLTVIDVTAMHPWRIGVPRLRGRYVLEAELGTFERWHLAVGDTLELREAGSTDAQ
ncbi:MAG: DUF192 domain-containing protein [Acidimicrobiales bacterium]